MNATFAQLGSVAEFINGVAFKPEDWGDSGTRIIRIQNLTDPSKSFNRTNRIVPEKFRVRPGDLLVSWSATLGVFEWPGPDEALVNQHIFRVLPHDSKVEKRYLRHALERALFEMRRHLHGATMQHVNREEFLSTRLYLPSLAAQRRIAEILDRTEALRAKRRATLDQLDSLVQATFLHFLGDPVINEREWPVYRLGELDLHIGDGNYSSKYPSSSEFVSTGIPFIRANNLRNLTVVPGDVRFITPKKHRELTKGHLLEGDVLITTRGEIGNVAIVPRSFEGANINAQIVLLRPKGEQVNSRYLAHLLHSSRMKNRLQSYQNGVALKQLPIRLLVKVPVPIPPVHLQREFARRVAAIEQLKTAQSASLCQLDALFASLQHRAFSGEL